MQTGLGNVMVPTTRKSLLMVGAGLSGAVLARQFAEAGHDVTVLDSRDHVGGNCHTARDPDTGVLVHVYGPHIFHTDDQQVWDFVNRFGRFRPYLHRVKTISGGRVYTMPMNLHSINQFFNMAMSPAQARAFVAGKAIPFCHAPRNFEEQALSLLGAELYDAFFKGYTAKQWGCDPTELPAAILKRLPLRFNYDDNYFFHAFQGMPEDGYTPIVAAMLDHPRIDLALNTRFDRSMGAGFDHVFYSGPLDGWFGHDAGALGYRTLDFDRLTFDGDYQGCAVMNYADVDVPHTRITEHKYFAPWENHAGSVCYRETSRACGLDDIPYYPIRLAQDKTLLTDYIARARAETGVTFVGRLGTYRYLDMDVTIREALDCAALYLDSLAQDHPMPAFAVAP